jgi:hypothetical protein
MPTTFTGFIRWVALIGFLAVAMPGCRAQPQAKSAVESNHAPLPVFTGCFIRQNGSSLWVDRVAGFEGYIELYGDQGWLKGFNDGRSIDLAMTKSNLDELDDGPDGILVKDVFLAFWNENNGPSKTTFIPLHRAERDRQIGLAIAQIVLRK